MKEKISQYLKQIQIEKDIKILLASEAGSRAWGFPSPDSDYDVRFIYVHKRNWYLSINEKKDTIEKMYNENEFDISGWDLKKSLNLLLKSNAPLLEIIQSPIFYMNDQDFVSKFIGLANMSYSKIAVMHHYLSMAKKTYSEINKNESIKLKKLFYSLRTAAVCKWIEDREEIPPTAFQTLIQKLDLDNHLKERINELIELKSNKDENYLHPQENEINHFIESCIIKAESIAAYLPVSKGNIEDFNSLFIESII
ncbi:MAG: hypothetical protein RLZZ546_1670 [Bacteroidota bacterium]|jgi:predicted nucleotidyltransferase